MPGGMVARGLGGWGLQRRYRPGYVGPPCGQGCSDRLLDRDGADGERRTNEALGQGALDPLRHHGGLVTEFAGGEVQGDDPGLAHQVVTAPRTIPVFRG